MNVSMGQVLFLDHARTHKSYHVVPAEMAILYDTKFREVDAFGGRRGLKIQALECIYDTVGDHEIAVPLSNRGHDIPGRSLGSGRRDHIFKRLHIFVP